MANQLKPGCTEVCKSPYHLIATASGVVVLSNSPRGEECYEPAPPAGRFKVGDVVHNNVLDTTHTLTQVDPDGSVWYDGTSGYKQHFTPDAFHYLEIVHPAAPAIPFVAGQWARVRPGGGAAGCLAELHDDPYHSANCWQCVDMYGNTLGLFHEGNLEPLGIQRPEPRDGWEPGEYREPREGEKVFLCDGGMVGDAVALDVDGFALDGPFGRDGYRWIARRVEQAKPDEYANGRCVGQRDNQALPPKPWTTRDWAAGGGCDLYDANGRYFGMICSAQCTAAVAALLVDEARARGRMT